MGSLSNLYISQSYQSLLHFGNDSSASTSFVELQDGVGNALGVSLNTLGDLDIERQLIVHTGAEITGAVDINTTFSGSTQLFVNQSSVNNEIRITGSYTTTGNQASITEIGIGWLVNGGAVSNARVIGITGTPNSDVTYTINQFTAANNVSYAFTGSIQKEVEIEGDLNVSDDLFVGGHLIIEDGVEITGSIDITGDVTASNAFIENDLNVGGTLFASKVVTLIESSSIIFSSGSNILGDSILDTQTLNGSIIMSGSSSLTGSMGITGNISSSTISGIGNVTLYSQSVDARLDIVEATASLYIPFSQSVDDRLDKVEATSSFLNTSASLALTTASFDNGTRNITFRKGNGTFFNVNIPGADTPPGTVSGSSQVNIYDTQNFATFNDAIQFDINQKLFTSSFNSYTQSTNNRLNIIEATYVTTGSNTFVGTEIFSGSVRGVVIPLTITAQTASIDCSIGNFFTLTLVSESNTRLIATNINPGQTISLKIQQSAPTIGTVSYPSDIKFPSGLAYSASLVTGSIDILTFVSYDSSSLFGVVVENFK